MNSRTHYEGEANDACNLFITKDILCLPYLMNFGSACWVRH
jgi:hypothetical protein